MFGEPFLLLAPSFLAVPFGTWLACPQTYVVQTLLRSINPTQRRVDKMTSGYAPNTKIIAPRRLTTK